MKQLWLFLSCILPLLGQPALHVDLGGEWRQSEGDNPAFAQPAFDDSAWRRIQLPASVEPPRGITWLRRQVMLPEWADASQLTLTLGTFAETYEVYVNGRKVGNLGHTGDLHRDKYLPRPSTMAIPAGLASPGRPLTLALRQERIRGGPRPRQLRALPDPGPYLLTYTWNAPLNVADADLLRRERLTALTFITCALQLLLAWILLITWLSERSRHDLAILAAFLLTECASRLIEASSILLDRTNPIYVSVAALALTAVLLFELSMKSFGFRLRWFHRLIWLAPIGAIITQTRSQGGFVFWLPLDAFVIAYCLWVAWRTWRSQGWRSGQLLLALSLAVSAFLHFQRIGILSIFDSLYFPVGNYLLHLYDTLIVILSTIITLILLRSLGLDRQEKQRLAAELDAARAVQQLLLVQSAGTDFCQVDAVYEPAQEVGGDFYWTRAEPDGALLVMVGDVSGKGLKAAMMVTLIMGALRQRTERLPAEVLSLLNGVISGESQKGFVTACCLRVERDGTVIVANAGHLAPYQQGCEVELEAGLPLGIAVGVSYTDVRLHLTAGEFLTLVSDGVVEAENAQRELFGFERTREIATKSAQEIADTAKAWGQNDDITVVTVRRRNA